MSNNIIGLIASFIFVILVIAISTILQKNKLIDDGAARKFIHIGVSNCWIIVMIFFDNIWLACIPPAAFIIMNYVSYRYNLIKSMEQKDKNSLGTVYYPISLLILVLVTFWLDMTYLGAVGILVMGYGDGLAGLIGKKFSKKKLVNNKTILGSTVMFGASFVVCLVVLTLFTPTIAITGSLLLAAIATAIELFTPHDLDNLTVPLGLALAYYLLIAIGSAATASLLIATVINGLVAVVAYRRKSLDMGGTITAIIIGITIYMSAGLTVWLLLMLFFVSSSVITQIKKSYKASLSVEYEKSRRNYKQVLSNGLMPAILSVLYFITKSDVMLIAAVTTIAVSCSDTWASEIGVLNKGKTISIINLMPVKKGESGGISYLGTISALTGSSLIALVYIIAQTFSTNESTISMMQTFVGISAIGLIGCFIDSILGATLQAKYLDSKTKLPTESKISNNKRNKKLSGIRLINNDIVNLSSSVIGGLIAVLFFHLM